MTLLSGLAENSHEPAWVTLKVWPAIVIVPDLLLVDRFAETEYVTVPFPLPPPPPVIVMNGALLVAVHAQPAGAVTPTLPLPPEAAKTWLAGEIK